MESAVKVDNLSVVLDGRVQALKGVSLELPAGKITGLIGPSGAGKTTLIRSIVGLLKTPSGAVKVFGRPAGSATLRQTVAYMAQDLSVYSDLTVKENLIYFARMKGQNRRQAQATVKELLETTDMTDKANTIVNDLSGGQQQRVSLAVALIGRPKLLALDEPTVELDPVLRSNLWKLFHRLAAAGTTLIISSHSMDEASRCDDLVLIRGGEVIAHSKPGKLLEDTKTESVEQAFLKLVGAA